MIRLTSRKLHSDFVHKVLELSGENIGLCYQCGLCSGACPMSTEMDFLPRQVIRLAQLGLEEGIANSKTVWLCASCLTCTVRCPRGIDLAKMMEAIRLITLRKNINYVEPSKLPPETIAELPQIALISSFRKHTA